MPKRTITSSLGVATWFNGVLSGDEALVTVLEHTARSGLEISPFSVGLEDELGLRETCRVALGREFSIEPPITGDPSVVY